MKKKYSLLYLIIGFIFAQLAWLALLGLWIYWYIANYLIFEKVGESLSPQITADSPNVLIFVLGIVLMVGIEVAMVFAFRNLTVQLKLTRLYDNFIGNISHELKSPLASIQLFLETLSRKELTDSRRKEFYGLMQEDTDRLKRLITSVLEISKLEQKTIAHDFRVFNASDIFKDLIYSSAKQFRVPSESVKFSGSADQKCVIDRDAMRIVFDNLMSNTVKYSPGEPEININLSSGEKNIIIDFCDKGIGILPKDQKKIFEKFQRITNKNVPNVKGTGLGLFWTRQILKFHGGKISVLSEGVGKGAAFRIRLPVYNVSGKGFVNTLLLRSARNKKLSEIYDGE